MDTKTSLNEGFSRIETTCNCFVVGVSAVFMYLPSAGENENERGFSGIFSVDVPMCFPYHQLCATAVGLKKPLLHAWRISETSRNSGDA